MIQTRVDIVHIFLWHDEWFEYFNESRGGYNKRLSVAKCKFLNSKLTYIVHQWFLMVTGYIPPNLCDLPIDERELGRHTPPLHGSSCYKCYIKQKSWIQPGLFCQCRFENIEITLFIRSRDNMTSFSLSTTFTFHLVWFFNDCTLVLVLTQNKHKTEMKTPQKHRRPCQ